jgi:hypothetical protein
MTKKPDPAQVVDELLKDITPPARRLSPMDGKPELVAALVRFLDLKSAGDERVAHVSFTWFYTTKLRPKFDGPGREAAREYVRNVLRRDPANGKPL